MQAHATVKGKIGSDLGCLMLEWRSCLKIALGLPVFAFVSPGRSACLSHRGRLIFLITDADHFSTCLFSLYIPLNDTNTRSSQHALLFGKKVVFLFFGQPEGLMIFFCQISQEILGWRAGLDAESIVWPLAHCSHWYSSSSCKIWCAAEMCECMWVEVMWGFMQSTLKTRCPPPQMGQRRVGV